MVTGDAAQAVIRLSGSLFAVGVRLAFPIVALLFMAEVALALLGRVNSELHISSHSFPLKILITLLMLGLRAGSLRTGTFTAHTPTRCLERSGFNPAVICHGRQQQDRKADTAAHSQSA